MFLDPVFRGISVVPATPAQVRGLASDTSAYFGRYHFVEEYVYILQDFCHVGSGPPSFLKYPTILEYMDIRQVPLLRSFF